MNIQAIMKQAGEMQKKIMKAQEEIEKMTFNATSGNVSVELLGTGKLNKINFNKDNDYSKDDIEMLEDMTVIAINEAIEQLNKIKSEKIGAYTNNMPGLF